MLLVLASLIAQELPIRSFGARDGLVHERVNDFLEDREGFLWIATWEGVSRFDGREFQSYLAGDGLETALVFAIAEDPRGRIWVGLNGSGVACLREEDERARDGALFRTWPVGSERGANDVSAIAFDGDGAMWVASGAGVYRAASDAGAPRFALVWRAPEPEWGAQCALEHDGAVWFLAERETLLARDGVVVEHPGPGGAARRDAVRAETTADGRAVVATTTGLHLFDARRAAAGESPWSALDVALDDEEIVHATAIDARGRVWVATVEGLACFEPGAAGRSAPRRITTENGLPDEWLRALCVTRDGALWIGMQHGGVARLGDEWIVSWRGPRGEPPLGAVRVLESQSGEIVVAANDAGLFVAREHGLVPVEGASARRFRNVGAGLLQDRRGAWWIPVTDGLLRAPGPELDLARAERVPDLHDVQPFGWIHEDARGELWLGTRASELVHVVPREDGALDVERALVDSAEWRAPRALLRDRSGTLWIAPFDGLWRRRDGDGAIEPVALRGELPSGGVRPRALLEDRRGRLWIGWRYGGVSRIDRPDDAEPELRTLSTRHGLPSSHVAALVEDADGRIWAGTGRGVACIDPDTFAMRVVTPTEGLAASTVFDLCFDREGSLWVATLGGVSRIRTHAIPEPAVAPPARILGLELGGAAHPLRDRGVEHVGGLRLASARASLVVRYGAVDLTHGERLEYQSRWDRPGAAWSARTHERALRLEELPAGAYRLLVRAVTPGGRSAGAPASVELVVLAPLWRRPWFVAFALALAGAGALGMQRMRARRRRALESVRAQISADLHDEIGASLTQIAILAELARREPHEAARARIADVAEVARSARRAMADLVWAIDPRRDNLLELVRRMRQTTGNLFEAGGLALSFRMPPEPELASRELGPNERRHLFCVFQEAATNCARHARAARVAVELAVDAGSLRLAVEDDGRGFDAASARPGEGLASMRRRAAALGAALVIDSAPGRGTRVVLELETRGGRARRTASSCGRGNGADPLS